AGGPGSGHLHPECRVGPVEGRSWRELVGGVLTEGHRGRGRGDGRAPPRRASRPTAVVAGAGGPVRGFPQAGAGRGAGWADVADPWPGLVPGGVHGDGLGLRPERTAVGDGVLGEDARARPGDLVAAVD